MKNLSFKVADVSNFSQWLKRFAAVEKSLLLELDAEDSQFIAKTYNEERSVVKQSKATFNDLGFEVTGTLPSGRIKVGLYDLNRIVKTFSHFSDPFTLTVKYEEVEEDSGKQLVGTQILLKKDDDSLKVGFECTSLSIFNYITDEMFTDRVCNVEEILSFDLGKEDFNKIVSLSDLDKEYKKIEFRGEDGKVFLKSKSFELVLGVCNGVSAKLPILKNQFSMIDSENYRVIVGENKMLLSSIESDTVTALGALDGNEYDSDKEMEL